MYLERGEYPVRIILTEESFHWSNGSYAGNWASAMGADIQFFITYPSDKDKDGDVDGLDLAVLINDFVPEIIQDFADHFGSSFFP